MTTHTITVELTDDEVSQVRRRPNNPAAPSQPDRSRAFGKFRDAVLALPEPPREPQVGDVVRHRNGSWTRTVRAFADGWVYLSPGSDGGKLPSTVVLATFHELYEVVS